jgi:hypothetical protein
MPETPFFDEYGRGPLTRQFQESLGMKPHIPGPGTAALMYAIRDAVDRNSQWPDQFVAMLTRAVSEIVPGLVQHELDKRLEPVRKAYAELKAELTALKAELKASKGIKPSVRAQAPNGALPVGK